MTKVETSDSLRTYTVLTRRAGRSEVDEIELVPRKVISALAKSDPSWTWLGNDMTASDVHIEIWYPDGVGSATVSMARPSVPNAPSLLAFDLDGITQAIHRLLNMRSGVDNRSAISTEVERLLADMLSDLEDGNSELARALDAAHIRIAFLEGELKGLREAMAMDQPGVQRAKLGVVMALLVALVTGASAGSAQQLIIEANEKPVPAVQDYQQRCENIMVKIDLDDQSHRGGR